MFMQCSQRIREGTTTWRVWTCWPEADATWASVCNWTAVTPPCCWEQERKSLKCIRTGMHSSRLEITWGRGECLWKASPHTGAFRVLDSSSCPQSGPYNTLLWLTIQIYNAVLLPRNRNFTLLPNIYVKDFYIFLGSQEQNQQVLKAWNYDKEFLGLLKLLKRHQGRTSHGGPNSSLGKLLFYVPKRRLIPTQLTDHFTGNVFRKPPEFLLILGNASQEESHQNPLCPWGRPHQDPFPKEAAGSCQCLAEWGQGGG